MNFKPTKEKFENYLIEVEKLKGNHNSLNKEIVEYELNEIIRTEKQRNEPLYNFCTYTNHYFKTYGVFNNYTKPKYVMIYADESVINQLNKLYLQINITPHTEPLVIPFSMCDKFELEQNKTMFVLPSDIFFDYSLKRYTYFETKMIVLSRDEELMKNIYDISILCEAYNEPKYDRVLNFSNTDISAIYQSISLCTYLQRYPENNYIKVSITDDKITKGIFVHMKTDIYNNKFKSVSLSLGGGGYIFRYSKNDIEKYIKTKFTNDSISFFLPFNKFYTEASDDEKMETVNKYKNDYDYRLIVDGELNLESYNNTIYMKLSELKATQEHINNEKYRYLYIYDKSDAILHFDNIDGITDDDINIYPLNINFVNAAC